MKVSRCTVQVIKEKIEPGDIKDRKKSARPTKLSKNDCRYLKITSLRNKTKTSQELGSDLAQTSGTQVHFLTVEGGIVKEGLHSRAVRRKTYLRQGNKQK